MVGIGNSISMNSASEDSDIDLLIVTEKNKMWLVRILVTLIFQVL
jgi:predicted nucleotidyltransferase